MSADLQRERRWHSGFVCSPIAVGEQSIARRWKGIFELRRGHATPTRVPGSNRGLVNRSRGERRPSHLGRGRGD